MMKDYVVTPRGCHLPANSGDGSHNRDSGSILIITFIFLIMVSLVVVTLASWTSNGLNNTLQFKTATNNLYAAEGVTQIAIRATRYTYPTVASGNCPGSSNPIGPMKIDGTYVEDWCDTVLDAGAYTRITTFTACELIPNSAGQIPTLGGPCFDTSGAILPKLLVAVVGYNDTTPDSNYFNPNCTQSNQTTCGASMTMITWKAS